jgi:hypothetical protein
MIVRRLAARRLVKSGSTEEEPRRKRAAPFLLAILVAGLISGADAWLGLWPFGSVQAVLKSALGTAPQLPAQVVFPSVQPTHKTVDVYDPPPVSRPAPPAQPTSRPTPSYSPRPTPSYSPRPTPRGAPSPDY